MITRREILIALGVHTVEVLDQTRFGDGRRDPR